MRRLLAMFFGFAVIVAALGAGPVGASAIEPDGGVALIAVDLGSTSVSEADAAIAETALRILVDSVDASHIALMPYSDQAGAPVGHEAGSDELDGAVSSLVQRIASRAETGGSDQFDALASAFSYLSGESAPAGSEIFLITGRMQDGSVQNRERIIGFADLFIAEGWRINTVMLPSATSDARNFLSSIVERASGQPDDAGTLDGLNAFSHRVLDFDGELVLDIALQSGTTAVQAVEVAPESTQLSVAMVRNSKNATLDLFDPHGVQLGSTSNAARFVSTPNLVVATIDSPEPGTWSLRATGDGRPLMASVDLRSPLQIALVEQPPVPAGQPAILMAIATINGEPRWLPGSVVTATVKAPDGGSVVYQLNDDGEGGDALLGDGVFSVVFDASRDQGFNDVELELGWQNYGATLNAVDSFQTEVFPTLKVVPAAGGSVEAGEEIVVGTLEVSVGEYPYPVNPSVLDAVIAGPTGASVTGTFRTIDSLEDGTGWRFEILATPSESGPQTVTAQLNAEYVGRVFSVFGPSAQTPVTVNFPVIDALDVEPDGSILPIVGGLLIALLVGFGVAFFMINRRQVMPHGYIYDDRQQLVVDLSSVRKSGLQGLFARGTVSNVDAPDLPLPGARLVFKRTGTELQYDNAGHLTMRVDGKPAGRVVHLRDGSRIGFSGRLFEFTTSRRQVRNIATQAPEPAVG
ncbi:MAG: hypothetical protein O3C10_08495 [Chloroflexi bacterium]|nr:hypothetical protein [Chloroflexota bacterium]